jgi:hypothetical protein
MWPGSFISLFPSFAIVSIESCGACDEVLGEQLVSIDDEQLACRQR